MKENVLDVLMYLFQHYIDEESDIEPDRETLQGTLLEAGFFHTEIDKAFNWLDGLALVQEENRSSGQTMKSIRVYANQETDLLDLECRGFLLYLEHTGVLDPDSREMVLDRVLALDTTDIDIERLKWVILMVLFNQSDHDMSFDWIENVVFDSSAEYLH